MWSLIHSIINRASSILVWGGVVTLRIGSTGQAVMDLSCKQLLGANRAGPAKQLADVLLSSKPTQLSDLNLR